MLGVDLYNGSPASVTNFKNQTGATYPLLLQGSNPTGGNVTTLYGGPNPPAAVYDNYVVINKQGIIRYHAMTTWPHGNRYHLNEIRGTVDSLVAPTVGVEDGIATSFSLGASPNPAFGRTTIAFTNPGPGAQRVEIAVHDVTGRRVAVVLSGAAAIGTSRFEWNGRREDGSALPAGLYLVTARFGGRTLSTRVTVLR